MAFGGHASGFGGSYAATTDATGHYTISGILPGTYAKVFAQAPGFEPDVRTLSVRSGAQTVDWEIQRDWASLSGGASVVDFNGVDYTPFGCGPTAIFDQSQGSGWSTDAVLSNPADEADVEARVGRAGAAAGRGRRLTSRSTRPERAGTAAAASTGRYRWRPRR